MSALIAWTALCTVAAVWLWAAAQQHASARAAAAFATSNTRIVGHSYHLEVAGPARDLFAMTAIREQSLTDGALDSDMIRFTLHNWREKKYPHVQVDLRSGTFVVRRDGESPEQSSGDFALEDAADLFAKAGYDPHDEAIRPSIASLVNVVTSTMENPEWIVQAAITLPAPETVVPGEFQVRASGTSGGSSTFRVPAATTGSNPLLWFQAGGIGIVAACLGGCWFIRRRHAHLVRNTEPLV